MAAGISAYSFLPCALCARESEVIDFSHVCMCKAVEAAIELGGFASAVAAAAPAPVTKFNI